MKKTAFFFALLLLALPPMHGAAATIDFEDQPSGPSLFSAAGNAQTLVYNLGAVTVTFSGGVILTNESGSVDLTNVYATRGGIGIQGPGFTNPINITFSSPVSVLAVLVTNELGGQIYTLAGGGGIAAVSGPAANQQFTLTLSEPFSTPFLSATIGSDNTSVWDFAIDNVEFTPAASVPEPSTLLLLASGLASLGARRLRRKTR